METQKGKPFKEHISQEGKEKERSKRVILEIGPGPLPFYIDGERKIDKDEIYFGIEPNRKSAQWASEMVSAEDGEATILRARGQELPIKNDYIDEVIIKNVFGEPEEKITITRLMENFAKELQRVVKNGGKIIIVETNTPFYTPTKDIAQVFARYGFKVNKELFLRPLDGNVNEETKQELKKYELLSFAHPRSYLLELVKQT